MNKLPAGPGDNSSIEISVILPTLNEQQTIRRCISSILQTLKDQDITGEIIVSDSSTDETPVIAKSMGAHVVYPPKKGYGNAYIEAFMHAKGRIIIIGDADDTYDFSQIPDLIRPILVDQADLVVGSRFMGTIAPGAMAWLHRCIGNPLLTFLLNIVFHTHFSDAHSGFRAIRRESLDQLHLKSGGMEFASEMLIAASNQGLRIEEVPINYKQRMTPSKLHSFADGWRHIRFILLYKPIPFLIVPGTFIALFGIFLMTLFYLGKNVEQAHLHSFILGSILLMGGVQVLLTGISIGIYSIVHGYGDKRGILGSFMDYHRLEQFLLGGGILTFLGLVLGVGIIHNWMQSGYGALSQISNAVLALTLIIIGIQFIFSSILVSMMLLNEGEPANSRYNG